MGPVVMPVLVKHWKVKKKLLLYLPVDVSTLRMVDSNTIEGWKEALDNIRYRKKLAGMLHIWGQIL
jgi:hypothetical protein